MGLLGGGKSKSGSAASGSTTGQQGSLDGSVQPINIQDSININLSSGDDLSFKNSAGIKITKVDLGSVNRAFKFAENSLARTERLLGNAIAANDNAAQETRALAKQVLDKPAPKQIEPDKNLRFAVLGLAAASVLVPIIKGA